MKTQSNAETVHIGLAFLPMWSVSNPPLGMTYVAASLRQAGFKVSIFDFNVRIRNLYVESFKKDIWDWKFGAQWGRRFLYEKEVLPEIKPFLDQAVDEILQEINQRGIQFLGFSFYDTGIHSTRYVSSRLKMKIPHLKIAWGRPVNGSSCFESDLVAGTVDAVALGEGEVTAVELFRSWSLKLPVADIEGISTYDKIKGVLPFKKRKELNLRDLPPITFDDFKSENYTTDSVPLMTSRGCTARCTFCSEATMWGKYRTRSVDSVISEMKMMKKEGHVRFVMNDSLLNGNFDYMTEFAKELATQDLGISFGGNVRVDPRFTTEIFENLRKAGCHYLSFGLESGSQKVLDLMRKGIKLEIAKKNFREATEAGIQVCILILVGFPGEGEAEFQETLDFIEENRKFIGHAGTGFGMVVGENMPVAANPDKYGILTDSKGQIVLDGLGYWKSVDGTNTVKSRMNRVERLWKHLEALDISYVAQDINSLQSVIVLKSGEETFSFTAPIWSRQVRPEI